LDAEGFGLIGRGQHNTAADGDRLPTQRRVEQLLDRRVERIEVRMEDGCFHLGPPKGENI
jgi:hypothetical protein